MNSCKRVMFNQTSVLVFKQTPPKVVFKDFTYLLGTDYAFEDHFLLAYSTKPFP